MAGKKPRKNDNPGSDPELSDSTIKPADPQLGPVEPLDTADDGVVLTDEGLTAPPGVGAPAGSSAPTGPVPGLVSTRFDLSLPPAAPADDADAAVGGPDPTGPAAGWYDSSARLPASVPPPDHPPSQSSLDIDVDASLSRLSKSGDPPSTQQIDVNPVWQPPAAGSSVDFSFQPPVKTPPPAEDYSTSDSSIELDIGPAVKTPQPPAPPKKAGSSVEVEMGPAVKTPAPVTPPKPGSEADIDLPPVPRSGEEPSDIFSTARRPSGSDAHGGTSASATGGSDVLADAPWGDKMPDSELFGPRPPAHGGGMMGPSSLDQPGFGGVSGPSSADDFGFGAMTGPSSVDQPAGLSGSSSLDQPGVSGLESSVFDQRGPVPTEPGSSVFDEDLPGGRPGEGEDLVRTEPNIALPEEDDPSVISGFDRVEKGESSSDLFGDATVVDMNLLADAAGSGVNLHESTARIDEAGEISSIFSGTDQPAGGGRVDLSDVPVGGEWADRTEAMTQPTEPPAPSSIFGSSDPEPGSDGQRVSFDLPARDDAAEYQDSANINWANESGAGDLMETAMEVHSGADELAAPDDEDDALDAAAAAHGKRPTDEESVFALPAIKAPIDSGLSDRLDEAVAAGVPIAPATRRADKPGGVSLATKRQPKPPTLPDYQPETPAKNRGLLVGALALLLGAGAGAGGMYFAGGSRSTVTEPGGGPGSVQPGGWADAGQIGLNPAAALRALEQSQLNSPAARAGRGQARWLARVRQAAAAGQPLTPDDPELLRARSELQGVFESSAELQSAEDKAAGLRAALHLGLIHEVLGDPAAARRVYEEARAKLPFAPVFQSALDRVRLMEKDAAGTVRRQYSLVTPAEAADLAGAVQLLDFPPVQEALNVEEEPAYHFWRAINFSVNWQQAGAFRNAREAITRAKQLHEDRRKKMIGMGLNPLSDPTEQAFTRMCEELALYWDFKGKLYDSPVAGPIVKKVGTGRTLDDLIAAKRDAGAGTAPSAELDKVRQQVAKLAGDLNTERTTTTKLTAANKQLTEDRQKAVANYETARTELGTKAKEAETAKAGLAAADQKLKAAEAAVDAAVVKLKEAKLIDAAADPATARAALPEALKKMVLVTGGDSATALTTALDTARKEKDAAEKKARDAETALAAARDDAAKKAAALEAATKAADERVAAAVKQATDAAAAEAKRYEDRLAAQAEQFRGQLAAVRSGAVVPLADVERAAVDKAKRSYAGGLEAYRARQYAAAEAAFEEAVKGDPADARYWYYLGLSKFAQGKAADARADFQKGADWEGRNRPNRRQVGEALLIVQGPARAALDTYRP